MASQLEKMLQETLGNLENLSPEKIHDLIQEALKTFTAIKDKSNSADPKEREEAFKIAMSLKGAIQAQTEEISKIAGIEPGLLNSLAENQDLFSTDTFLELSTAKVELEALRDQLGMKTKKTTSTAKKNKAVRIPG